MIQRATLWASTLLLAVAGSAACRDGGDARLAPPTPTAAEVAASPAPGHTATATASPTPFQETVAEGWERHRTTSFQIDLPSNWRALDLTEESLEAVRGILAEEMQGLDPNLVAFVLQFLTSELVRFVAFDTRSVGLPSTVGVLRAKAPYAVTVPEMIAAFEGAATEVLDGTVLASETDLTIGGLKAGSVQVLLTMGDISVAEAQYVVLPEPTVVFTLGFITLPEDFAEIEPVLRQIAKSFRVLD